VQEPIVVFIIFAVIFVVILGIYGLYQMSVSPTIIRRADHTF
jgi:thiol:disulfide interchange protein